MRIKASKRRKKREVAMMSISCLGLTVPDSLERDAHQSVEEKKEERSCDDVHLMSGSHRSRLPGKRCTSKRRRKEKERSCHDVHLMSGSHRSRLPGKRCTSKRRRKEKERSCHMMFISCLGLTVPDSLKRDAHQSVEEKKEERSCDDVHLMSGSHRSRLPGKRCTSKRRRKERRVYKEERNCHDVHLVSGSHRSRLPGKRCASKRRTKERRPKKEVAMIPIETQLVSHTGFEAFKTTTLQ